MDFESVLNEQAARFEQVLQLYWPEDDTLVAQAMRYSLGGGGKRIRPVLTAAFCELFGGQPGQADAFAVAIEMVHTYSLIHDDLPLMDDDDYRRGRLSCHRQFGEQAALLAGDALLTQAFTVIAEAEQYPPQTRCQAASLLAGTAGWTGMIFGQWLDLKYANLEITQAQLEEMNLRKTGALMRAACGLGCLAAGAGEEQAAAATRYANAVGLLFQVTDDILDAPPEKGGEAEGASWVTLCGLAHAKQAAAELAAIARREIAPYAGEGHWLYDLPGWMEKRTY